MLYRISTVSVNMYNSMSFRNLLRMEKLLLTSQKKKQHTDDGIVLRGVAVELHVDKPKP